MRKMFALIIIVFFISLGLQIWWTFFKEGSQVKDLIEQFNADKVAVNNEEYTEETENTDMNTEKVLHLDKIDELFIKELLEKDTDIYLPILKKAEYLNSISLIYSDYQQEKSFALAYQIDEPINDMIYLQVSKNNSESRLFEQRLENLDKEIAIDIKGFSGYIGYDKRYDDSSLLIVEKDGYIYHFEIFNKIKKQNFENVSKSLIEGLGKEFKINSLFTELANNVDDIKFPISNENIEIAFVSLTYSSYQGAELALEYRLADSMDFRYEVVPGESPDRLYLEDYEVEARKTKNGHQVKVYHLKESEEFEVYSIPWEQNKINYMLSFYQGHNEMTVNKALEIIDEVIERE